MLQSIKAQLDAHRESTDPVWKTINIARGAVRDVRCQLLPSSRYLTEPFGGDDILADVLANYVAQCGVKTVIETGTNVGASTALLARMAPRVLTIEANAKFVDKARENLKEFTNIEVIHGDSSKVLPDLLRTETGPVLFFLDAHWKKHWPLLDELRAIADTNALKNSVIVIHDMYVPGQDFGYDVYGGRRLDIEYVRDALLKINPDFEYAYPADARGCRRGWVAIHQCMEGFESIPLVQHPK